MKFIQGTPREQLVLISSSLEETINPDNEVRLIDLFVSGLELKNFGFRVQFVENGRPAYHPSDLLKLFIYGYLNRIRSSRGLERECQRNIELMWLLKGLVPDHNTIANFRKDNPEAIRKVFRSTVQIAKHFDLIGGKLLAGDSTKLRAQNSKKNNFNQAKIDRHIAYIDTKLDEYREALAEEDNEKKSLEIREKIKHHKKKRREYRVLEQQLKDSGEVQVSTSDPDSRQMITRNNITEVAYNIQTTVDSVNSIPIDYLVTNENDSKAMGNMLGRAKSILGTDTFVALYDKGYHTGSEFEKADKLKVHVMVAIPEVASSAPDPAFNVEHFVYNEKNDSYTCPAKKQLFTNRRWYTKKSGKSSTQVKHYKTSACGTCKLKELCTRNPKGRLIERSEYAELIEQNKKNIDDFPHIYKLRQQIVEHPYGTIKRQWDFSYILTKRFIHRATADVGLIFTAYNFRRLISLVGFKVLKNFLKKRRLTFALYSILADVFKPRWLNAISETITFQFNFRSRLKWR